MFAIFTHVKAILDTTYSVKVHKLFICFTNNGVYSLHIDTCFLKIIASCIVPFNRMDAGLVWKELVILFFMRVVKLLVMCCTAMSLPPGVYGRIGNLIV